MSPRCKKPRRCSCPFHGEEEQVFKPAGIPLHCLEQTRLHHDELEAMYLCDSEGLTQEEAGTRMGVSRGTVQRLLAVARKKIIEALVTGSAVSIERAGRGKEN
jgi:predicted DNA-binding protein (UPF0251 family)